jgi:hypothetical protein
MRISFGTIAMGQVDKPIANHSSKDGKLDQAVHLKL